MDRPPADPAKLRTAWIEWETGETPPGRVVSNLKTGGFRVVLEHLAAEAGTEAPGGADATRLLAVWMEWETGDTPPGAVLVAMAEAGGRGLLDALVDAAVAAAASAPPEG
ncbi:MAG TPA: hypothetical protein VEW93_10070 [Acidimicrobiales bacterium]|nr:hypothetical protein [Acidimicrobiales bacterium]